MTSDQCIFLMMGLPKTGKTTFLAALWYVVNHPDELPLALKLNRLQGDDSYLNLIQKNWLRFEQVDRTKIGSEKVASMELIDPQISKVGQILFPDLSGERFRQQFEERVCSKYYVGQVQESVGALFFIHSGEIIPPTRIDEAESLAQTIRSPAEEPIHNQEEHPVPWESSQASTQVKQVELLQFLSVIPNLRKPFHIAIILSAWDLICEISNFPKEFLKKRLPLFDQYLKTNSDQFITKVFGVSAQGATYDEEDSRVRLADKSYNPSERILVKSENVDSHDITEPVKWLMECTHNEE